MISGLTVSSMDWNPLYKIYSCGLGAALAVGTDDTLPALISHMDPRLNLRVPGES